jgi:hypothetical protein
MAEMQASMVPKTGRAIRYCKTKGCTGIHYAKGMCRKCYYKSRYKANKDRKYPKGTSLTIHFSSIEGGKDMLAMLRRIAKHEDRSPNKQAIHFIAKGLLDWLHDHEDD